MKNVIARMDTQGRAVVFNADSLEKGQIEAFIDGKTERVGIDYYYNTMPLSDNDEKDIVKNYSTQNSIPDITIRRRLPKRFAQMSRPDIVQHTGNSQNGNAQHASVQHAAQSVQQSSPVNKRQEAARQRFVNELNSTKFAALSKADQEKFVQELGVKIAGALMEMLK